MSDQDGEGWHPRSFLEEVFAEHPIEIMYDVEPLLDDANPNWDELGPDERWQLQERLRAALVAKLPSLSSQDATIETEEPEPDGQAGGGEFFDSIWLVVHALEAYAAIRFFGDDIKKIMKSIEAITKRQPRISDGAALILAWWHVAPQGSEADVALQYVAPLNRFVNGGWTYQDGWLVGLKVDGRPTIVQVGPDGDVGVAAPGIELPDVQLPEHHGDEPNS